MGPGSHGSPVILPDINLLTYAYNEDSELHSNDADFARFSGLTWRNPIA